jgi:predicted RNA-binding protein YlxR (DUF448 family)
VVSPDGEIAPDILEKLPGRGIWVSADRDAIETAVKKNLFARAAKTKVTWCPRIWPTGSRRALPGGSPT